jgi:hypothetical protein
MLQEGVDASEWKTIELRQCRLLPHESLGA